MLAGLLVDVQPKSKADTVIDVSVMAFANRLLNGMPFQRSFPEQYLVGVCECAIGFKLLHLYIF